ncbi:fatty acid synthase-like protein, partial [Dinothrombium tinctorium]
MSKNVQSDEIVVSGIAGRFPEADDIEELWSKLMNGIELSSTDDRRWPLDVFDLPKRSGKIKHIEKFDADFFGVNEYDANCMDPQIRLLHETTWEAIFDAALLNDTSKTSPASGLNARGFMIVNEKCQAIEKRVIEIRTKRPLIVLFTAKAIRKNNGLNELMKIKTFDQSMDTSLEVLRTLGVDLSSILDADLEFESFVDLIVYTIVVHIAIADTLKYLKLKVDRVVGESIAKISADYYDGCLTAREAILSGYAIGKCLDRLHNESKNMNGDRWKFLQQFVSFDGFGQSAVNELSNIINSSKKPHEHYLNDDIDHCLIENYVKVIKNGFKFVRKEDEFVVEINNDSLLGVGTDQSQHSSPDQLIEATNINRNYSVANGAMIIKHIIGTPTARRVASDQMPDLEEIRFSPFVENVVLSKVKAKKVNRYITMCSETIEKLKRIKTSKYEENGETTIKEYIENSSDDPTLLKMLYDALTEKAHFNNGLMEKYKFEVAKDLLLNISKQELFRSQIDLAFENMNAKSVNIIECNLTSNFLFDTLCDCLDKNGLTSNYKLLHRSDNDTSSLPRDAPVLWQNTDCLPTYATDIDFILFKDWSTSLMVNEKLAEYQFDLSAFIDSCYKSLKPNGFLLLQFRTSITSLEEEILQLQGLDVPKLFTLKQLRNLLNQTDFSLIGEKIDQLSNVTLLLPMLKAQIEDIYSKSNDGKDDAELFWDYLGFNLKFQNEERLKVRDELRSLITKEQKCEKLIQIFNTATGKECDPSLLTSFIERYANKSRLLYKFNPSRKFIGSVKLIRAKEKSLVYNFKELESENYGLSKDVDGEVSVVTLQGYHETLIGENVKSILNIIEEELSFFHLRDIVFDGLENVSKNYKDQVATTNIATGKVSWRTLDKIKVAIKSDNPKIIVNAIEIPMPESIIVWPKVLNEFVAKNLLLSDTSTTFSNEFKNSYYRRFGLVYSKKGSLTGSHIDFGCANCFHVITGKKWWAVSLNTEDNMAMLSNCDIQNVSFHPSEMMTVKTFISFEPDATLFMPAAINRSSNEGAAAESSYKDVPKASSWFDSK